MLVYFMELNSIAVSRTFSPNFVPVAQRMQKVKNAFLEKLSRKFCFLFIRFEQTKGVLKQVQRKKLEEKKIHIKIAKLESV